VSGSIRDELLGRTLERERRYWSDTATALRPPLPVDQHVRCRAVAIATLASPTTTGSPAGEEETAALLETLPDLRGDTAVRRRVARWLHGLYTPAGSGWIAPLEPDLLGEALVSDALINAPRLARDLLGRVDAATATRALTVLARGSRHDDRCRDALSDALDRHLQRLAGPAIEVAQQLGDTVGVPLARALERHPDSQLARTVVRAIPPETVALRDAAAVATAQALRDTPQDSPDRAELLIHHSNRLSDLGQREDALTAINEAVRVYRALADARPDAFLPNLAGSLNNQSNRLSDLGQREDALTAINEAVRIYRALADARPDAFLPNLAESLNNQSNRLSDLGRHEDALTAINEAVRIRRALADARPDAFLPNLAGSLNNESNRLSDLGRHEDALTAINEAVHIYRALADARPDAFLPNLATSLNYQSTFLSGLRRHEDALTAIHEAVRQVLPMLERAHYVLPDAGLALLRNYVRRSVEADRHPDTETVRRLRAVLASHGVIEAEE
jgi:tetratricopeptide (TPR) repeat protein